MSEKEKTDADDIHIVRDVGTLVEFAATEENPPPIPKKLFKRRSDETVTQKFGSLTRADAIKSTNGWNRAASTKEERTKKKRESNGYPSPDHGVYYVSGDSPSMAGILPLSEDNGASKDRRVSEQTGRIAVFTSGSPETNSDSVYVSHAIVTVCSLLYCLILSAIGLAFPLAYLIMFRSQTFNINIYQAYFIYLYGVGIVIQLIYLFKKLCDACDSVYSKPVLLDYAFRAFGTKGLRTFAGVFGVFSCLWFLILFAWRIDVFRETGMRCLDKSIEVAVIALALVYTLLHVFIVFYNTKLMVSGYELYILVGLMHLVATDLSSWAMQGVYIVLITLTHRNQSGLQLDPCDKSSALTSLVSSSHHYFGLVVMVFFLVSAFLLISVFLHHHERGSFLLNSTLDQMLKDATHVFSLRSNALGAMASFFLTAGGVVFLVYHYLLKKWGRETEALLAMEVICLGLELLSIIISILLIFVHHRKTDNLSRPLTLETLTISVSIFFLFVFNIGYTIACFKAGGYVHYWAVAGSILEILETLVQAALLLSALKYYAKFFGHSAFRIQQSATFYMFFYNFWMAVFIFVRQDPQIYGQSFLDSFGPWFYAIWTFILMCFKVLYRLFCCVCFGSLWIRAFRS